MASITTNGMCKRRNMEKLYKLRKNLQTVKEERELKKVSK